MDVIQVVGKANFHSAKKNQDYFVLHCLESRDQVDGLAVDTKFVSSELFSKVSLDKQYYVIYGCYSNGRAYISDLREVKSKE